MHTARALTVPPSMLAGGGGVSARGGACLLWGRGGVSALGGFCSGGVCLLWGGPALGGSALGGGCIPACTEVDTPLLTE